MNVPHRAGFFERTLQNLRQGWRTIAGASYDAEVASTRPDLPDDDVEKLRRQMEQCLTNRGGEVSARAKAAALGQVYLALDQAGRERFLRVLAEDYGTDHRKVDAAMIAVREAVSEDERRDAEDRLRAALEAPRRRLITQFNALPEGVKFLVDMRAELLPLARQDPMMGALDRDLRSILTSWFDVDFLELRRITWDNAPGALLEKLIAYEAVHEIASWDDLKNRLDSDRRCFGYFHPRMPNEPLIFVEVALVNGLSGNVQELLDESAPVADPHRANTAIFYSISNAQRGLAGISFGNFLIKRVVGELQNEFPRLKTYSTLSPIPGFRKWLDEQISDGAAKLVLPGERKALREAAGNGEEVPGRGGKGTLKALLQHPGWWSDPVLSEALRAPLMRLCARYLAEEKHRNGRARDPVAHFHLTNGARVERINWMGDTSEKGLKQAAGMMANYLYDLDRIEDNHESYTATGEVAVSSSVRTLLKD